MFNPPMPRPTSEYSLEPQVYPSQPYHFQHDSSPTLDLHEPPVVSRSYLRRIQILIVLYRIPHEHVRCVEIALFLLKKTSAACSKNVKSDRATPVYWRSRWHMRSQKT